VSTEAPLPSLVVHLPFPTQEEFLRRHGANLTAGGLYVRSRTVKPPGTVAVLEARLEGGARLLYAQVHVDFVTGQDGKGKSGMGLRFTHVDAETQRFLDKVAASYLHARTLRPPLPPNPGRVDRAPEPEPAPVALPQAAEPAELLAAAAETAPALAPEPAPTDPPEPPVSADPQASVPEAAATPDMQESGGAGVKGFFRKLFGG
jgi:molecular chaperone DnaK